MVANSITRVAGLIGESGRIQMLIALLDGRGHSASDLALTAGVSPQTASSHLSKLLSGGLVASERKGRQRLFRIKNRDVAMAIESLGALVQDSGSPAIPEMRFARTCYDHLAGILAIALRNELLKREILRSREDGFLVTPGGERFLRTLDINAESLRQLRRSFGRKCLDWTERDHHIGGSIGAALLSRFMQNNWLAKVHNTRAVRMTHEGEQAFERVFSIRRGSLRL